MTRRRTDAAAKLEPRRLALYSTALVVTGAFAAIQPNTPNGELTTTVALRVYPGPQRAPEPVFLGELIGRELRVRLYITPDDTRFFDVYTNEGKLLAHRITEQELFKSFPQLQLDTLTLSCPEDGRSTAIMLADAPVGG